MCRCNSHLLLKYLFDNYLCSMLISLFPPKLSISYFKPILAAIVVTIATVKDNKLIRTSWWKTTFKFYLIGGGGQKCPLMHVALYHDFVVISWFYTCCGSSKYHVCPDKKTNQNSIHVLAKWKYIQVKPQLHCHDFGHDGATTHPDLSCRDASAWVVAAP